MHMVWLNLSSEFPTSFKQDKSSMSWSINVTNTADSDAWGRWSGVHFEVRVQVGGHRWGQDLALPLFDRPTHFIKREKNVVHRYANAVRLTVTRIPLLFRVSFLFVKNMIISHFS